MNDYIVYREEELVIDGHRCRKLDTGIYETCDAYIVTKDIWKKDKRNKGLVLITIRENAIEDRVIYVVTQDYTSGIRELQDSIDGDSIYCI
ncbi:MAG: hypothetical protein NC089_07025 [Bacteroides sp.]|nr:hypothetical protein [Bacteroides sp.]MCM1548398.1 hypothetical protein [Clostridium sp.]